MRCLQSTIRGCFLMGNWGRKASVRQSEIALLRWLLAAVDRESCPAGMPREHGIGMQVPHDQIDVRTSFPAIFSEIEDRFGCGEMPAGNVPLSA